jgi:hypothetical protein
MNTGKTILTQITDFIPRYEFNKCVERYSGNKWSKGFSCWDQFLCMLFAQLTYRDSLRDIEICLKAIKVKLYQLGFRCKKISRSTLADANERRDWRIFADFAQVLITEAKSLYRKDDNINLNIANEVYALDATVIDLCLSLFPWGKFRTTKAGIKLHTLLDLKTEIPDFIEISEAAKHEIKILDSLILKPFAFYVMDRAYVDFKRLYKFTLTKAFFVTRSKGNTKLDRLYSLQVDRTTGVLSDHLVIPRSKSTRKKYPDKLRRIRFYDKENNIRYAFLTNNFELDSITICKLYKSRWKIEIFFKWIKQNLKIKTFFGTSENAVKTQVWIAISSYVLIAIIKKKLNLQFQLNTVLQVFSLMLFEKTPVLLAFSDYEENENMLELNNQLNLFNY